MKQTFRALAFAAALLPAIAAAQVPNFPQTLPANTVVGRLGVGAGPSQAIPFSVLASQLSRSTGGCLVTGPSSFTAGHVAIFGATGCIIADGGAVLSAARTISTTAPLAGGGDLSANRTLSITGSAGGVLAGSGPAFTTTPTLGASGTLGTLTFGNATSGTVTLQPVAGALGSSFLTMPAATDTIALLAASQIFTNKTMNCANNTCTVRLASDVTGTVQATNFPALTGEVTTPGGSLVTTVTNSSVIGKLLTAFSAGAGTVSSSDSILTAFQKVVGNFALKVDAARNISTGCGLAGGGDLSADRTIRLSLTVNAQTGTTYTILDGDCGKLVRFNNASAVAVTLPQANGSTFISGWSVDFQNIGAGTVTVTPTTSLINGGASIALTQNQGMHCDSDGTNYSCVLGVGAGAGSGTVTQVVCGTGLTGGTITASGTCAIDKATAANLEAGTSNKVLTADIIYDSEVTLTFSTTPTWDFNTFLNGRFTLTNNVSSLTCSNIKASQSGTITLVQDGTGTRTMVAGWCSQFRWAGGSRGVLSTAASTIDALFYTCVSTSICYVSLSKAQAN